MKFAIDSSVWVSQFITFLSFFDMKIFQILYIYTHILRKVINSRNNLRDFSKFKIYYLLINCKYDLHDISQISNIKDIFTYLKFYE